MTAVYPNNVAPLFDRRNNIWWRVQIVKLLITQSSIVSCLPAPL
jgi:hypothetical protein